MLLNIADINELSQYWNSFTIKSKDWVFSVGVSMGKFFSAKNVFQFFFLLYSIHDSEKMPNLHLELTVMEVQTYDFAKLQGVYMQLFVKV